MTKVDSQGFVTTISYDQAMACLTETILHQEFASYPNANIMVSPARTLWAELRNSGLVQLDTACKFKFKYKYKFLTITRHVV